MKEMTVKQRLIEYLAFKKIGRNKFEKSAGISLGYITNLKGSIGSDVLVKIITAAPDINLYWLLTGNGSMIKGEQQMNDEGAFFSKQIDELKAEINKLRIERDAFERVLTMQGSQQNVHKKAL